MKLFGLGAAAPLVFGSAMLALTSTTATAEQVDAANQELDAAGIKGAQLVPGAVLDELTAKAGRVDAAEATAKGFTEALTAAGATDVAALVAQRDGFKVKADQFDKQAGATHTQPTLPAGTTDVDQGEPDAHQVAIDNLPHNKALAGHPIFG